MHLADDGGNPQGECAGDRHGNQDDDQGVPQCDPENLILEQGLVVAKAHENVRAAHGCVEEAGIDAHKHGVQDKHGKENQERKHERIAGHGFVHNKLPGLGVQSNSLVRHGESSSQNL